MSDSRNKSLIVVGPGERVEELAAALGGLLARAPMPGARMMALEDLAQLLLMRADAGRLLLDGDQVPAEDIGILRRFLEDRPGWTLHVVGMPEAPPEALLALPGAELVAWEPDLATLRALACGSPAPRSSRPAAREKPAAAPQATPESKKPSPPAAKHDTCDLSVLLDDLIVARALADNGADYRFEPPGELAVSASEPDVAAVLEGGLGLAEACAGPDGQVEVRAGVDSGQALVEVVFPPGALTDGDLPSLLAGGTVEGPAALVSASKGAGEAARLATELSGGLALNADRGKLRLELRLPLNGPA